MGREIVVEVVTLDGQVLERHRHSAFPLRIGRAYSNQLIINDPHVCPEHLVIEETEGQRLNLRDLATINGLRGMGSSLRLEEVELSGKMEFRIGRTILRLVDPEFLVPPALPLRKTAILEFELGQSIRVWHAVSLWLIFIAAFMINSYVLGKRTDDNQPLELLFGVLTFSLFLLFWAGLWALVGKSAVKKFRLEHHLAIILVAMIAQMAIARALEFYEFAFAASSQVVFFSWIVWSVIAASIISEHLRAATELARVGRLTIAIGIVGVLVSMSLLYVYNNTSEFSTELPIVTNIEPPWMRLVSGRDPGELSEKLRDLAGEL